MRARLLAALAPVVVLGALAPPAFAGTVSVVTFDSCDGDTACSKYGQGEPVPVTVVTGAAGESNRVTVTRDASGFVVRDAGAVLQALAPCQAIDANNARCPITEGRGGIPGLRILGEDGGDEAVASGQLQVVVEFLGGGGADVFTGGSEPDEVDGGPGDDTLVGGDGIDTLHYDDRDVPVVVDLGRSAGGQEGELDALNGFEIVVGGKEDDSLRGGRGDETLDGGSGDDELDGAGGDDSVFGGIGTDRIAGGSGDDRLFGDPEQGDDYYSPTFRFGNDRIEGGPGDDELYDTGGRNVLEGGSGRDLLEGGEDRDRLDGNGGNDRIDSAGDRTTDRVNCGAGRDRALTDPRDRRRGCERRWRRTD